MRTSLFAVVGMLCLPAIASADLFQFSHNLFVGGNMNASNSKVEGTLAVGGNLTLNSYSVGLQLPTWDGSSNSLVVGGDANIDHGTISHGNLRYGGTATLSSMAFPTGGNAAQGSPLDFAALQNYYLDASSYFSTLATSGNISVSSSTLNLNATGNGLNVFNITMADLSSINTIRINASSSATVLVNIDGESAAMQFLGMSLSGGLLETHVLYNFPTATTLTIQGIGLLGSVLAPQADLTFNSGVVLGDLAVGSFTGAGQVNRYDFTGEIPLPVPEPATATLGLIGLGLLTLRRHSRTA